jgi:hypothetical protein
MSVCLSKLNSFSVETNSLWSETEEVLMEV